MTVRAVLLQAADHIDKVGLHKGDFFAPGGPRDTVPCCTLGALEIAAEGPLNSLGLLLNTHTTLRNFLRLDPGTIPQWNDLPGRTKEQVVDSLRACAASLPEESNAQHSA